MVIELLGFFLLRINCHYYSIKLLFVFGMSIEQRSSTFLIRYFIISLLLVEYKSIKEELVILEINIIK